MLVLKTPEELRAERELKINPEIESFRARLRGIVLDRMSKWKGDVVEIKLGNFGVNIYEFYPTLNTKEKYRLVLEIINELEDYGWIVRYDTEGDTIKWIQINQEDRWFVLLIKKIFGTKKDRGGGLLYIS
jgi:hypothetical protein